MWYFSPWAHSGIFAVVTQETIRNYHCTYFSFVEYIQNSTCKFCVFSVLFFFILTCFFNSSQLSKVEIPLFLETLYDQFIVCNLINKYYWTVLLVTPIHFWNAKLEIKCNDGSTQKYFSPTLTFTEKKFFSFMGVWRHFGKIWGWRPLGGNFDPPMKYAIYLLVSVVFWWSVVPFLGPRNHQLLLQREWSVACCHPGRRMPHLHPFLVLFGNWHEHYHILKYLTLNRNNKKAKLGCNCS